MDALICDPTDFKWRIALDAGQMLALHAGIAHKVLASEESLFLLTMSSRVEKK